MFIKNYFEAVSVGQQLVLWRDSSRLRSLSRDLKPTVGSVCSSAYCSPWKHAGSNFHFNRCFLEWWRVGEWQWDFWRQGDSEMSGSRKVSRVSGASRSYGCGSSPTPHLSKSDLLSALPWRYCPTVSSLVQFHTIKSGGAMCSTPPCPENCAQPCQPLGCREAGVQGWVLQQGGAELGCGHLADTSIVLLLAGLHHACDNSSLSSGGSAGTWWLFRLGWVFFISSDAE